MDFLKVIIQKLSVLKKSSSLLVPIIVGLVGILLLIPTQLVSSKLTKQIESESIAKRGRRIQSLGREAVSSEQWKEEAARQKEYASDANDIALLAKRSTQRELLSYKIFPEPKDKSQFTFKEFGKKYNTALEALVTSVNARDCPTEAELNRALEKSPKVSGLQSRYREADLSMRLGARTRPVETPYGARNTVEDTIVDEICRDRARSASVYINPVDLSGYEFWREYKYDSGIKEAVEDCWYSQLTYWVIEDVINTIGAMNADAGSKSVITSPVKRLINVTFNLVRSVYGTDSIYGGRMPSSNAGTKKTGTDRPVYIFSPRDSAIESCTARYCNDDTDVIHFKVVVIVSTKAVLPFMQQLCSAKEHKFAGFSGNEQEQIYKRNQITILESKMRSINREAQRHRLYRYSDEAVVEMDLICEYIFNKAGYEEIKPESVKEAQTSADKNN